MTTVLVQIADRPTQRHAVTTLRSEGYTVVPARTRHQFRALLHRRRPDAVIMDSVGHVAAVAAVRTLTEVPLIVVSSTRDEWEMVDCLDAGADDYLATPYSAEELLARLRALIRRASDTARAGLIVTARDFIADVDNRRWFGADGAEVHLTPTEWRLVELLLHRPDELVTQAELLCGAWGPYATAKTEYLRVYFTGIRHKVEPEPGHPRYFITAPGLGMRFDPTPAPAPHPA